MRFAGRDGSGRFGSAARWGALGRTAAAGLLAAALAACAAADGAPAPSDPAYGVDVCERCRMSVDDPTLAAEWVDEEGRTLFFDEPGCLVDWVRRNPGAPGTAFVADTEGGGWLRADSAAYLHLPGRTGMGYGLLAFALPDDARARAAEAGGEVLDWRTVVEEGVEHAHAH